jgi:hypothetical protein
MMKFDHTFTMGYIDYHRCWIPIEIELVRTMPNSKQNALNVLIRNLATDSTLKTWFDYRSATNAIFRYIGREWEGVRMFEFITPESSPPFKRVKNAGFAILEILPIEMCMPNNIGIELYYVHAETDINLAAEIFPSIANLVNMGTTQNRLMH